MKGVIFNAVESAVVELFDEDMWDAILDGAEVEGAYTALGSYPDAELMAIVASACALTGRSVDDLLRTIGRHGLPALARSIDDPCEQYDCALDFIAGIHEVIHVEVRKADRDAEPPIVVVDRASEDRAFVHYRSDRGLPSLAEGLLVGAGDLFGETLEVERLSDGEATGRPAAEADRDVIFIVRRKR